MKLNLDYVESSNHFENLQQFLDRSHFEIIKWCPHPTALNLTYNFKHYIIFKNNYQKIHNYYHPSQQTPKTIILSLKSLMISYKNRIFHLKRSNWFLNDTVSFFIQCIKKTSKIIAAYDLNNNNYKSYNVWSMLKNEYNFR